MTSGVRTAAARACASPAVHASLVVAVALVVLAPLLAAGFHSDDLGWLAFARQAATPWPAFVEPQIFGYFYRPSAFIYWWLAERAAGTAPALHYAISIALHAATGLMVALWLRRSGLSMAVATLAAMAVLASLPVSGTALWLSSRNETLALACGVAALALAPRAASGRSVAVGALLLVACTAKETGLLFAAAVAVQTMIERRESRPWRLPLLWAAMLPALAALLARQWVILPIGLEADGIGSVSTLLRDGVLPWWRHWPAALSGWGTPFSPLAVAGVVVIALLAAAGLAALRRHQHRGLVSAALLLVVLPSALQSPITSLVLPQPGADTFLVNLRFFATATLGLVVLAAIGLDQCAVGMRRRLGLTFAVVLLLLSGFAAHRQVERWRVETATLGAPLAVAEALPAGIADEGPSPCIVDVRGTGLSPGLAPYLDSAVRALAPRGRPPRCLVLADGIAPHFAFFDAAACAPDAGWAAHGLNIAVIDGRPLADRFGALCQIALRADAAGMRPTSQITLGGAPQPR